MSGKPIDQGFLKRILGSAFEKAGGSVGPGGATQVNVPSKNTWKQEGWIHNPGDTVWKEGADPSMGMPQFPPEQEPDPHFTEIEETFFHLRDPGIENGNLEWTDPYFMSRWGAETPEGIRDFGVRTLQDPYAPERRERDWDAMQKADQRVYGKRAKQQHKAIGRRDRRDRLDDARSGFSKSALGGLYDPYKTARKSISDFELREAAKNLNPADRANLYRLAGKGFDVGRAGLYAGTGLGLKGVQRGARAGVRGARAGAKYGVIDPLKRAGGLARSGISATDAKILYAAKQLRSEGQRLGTAQRGSKYLGLQKGAIAHTLPASTGSLNGVMRGLAGLFILFIFISVFYMVFGPVYDVLITNFLSIAGADGSTMLGGKDIAVLYANTANAILIWVPLIVIGGTLYLLISMVFERESKGMAGANIMTEWDVFGGMDDDTDINLDIALDGGMDDSVGFYGPS